LKKLVVLRFVSIVIERCKKVKKQTIKISCMCTFKIREGWLTEKLSKRPRHTFPLTLVIISPAAINTEIQSFTTKHSTDLVALASTY
jgi:hypothetical protein